MYCVCRYLLLYLKWPLIVIQGHMQCQFFVRSPGLSIRVHETGVNLFSDKIVEMTVNVEQGHWRWHNQRPHYVFSIAQRFYRLNFSSALWLKRTFLCIWYNHVVCFASWKFNLTYIAPKSIYIYFHIVAILGLSGLVVTHYQFYVDLQRVINICIAHSVSNDTGSEATAIAGWMGSTLSK